MKKLFIALILIAGGVSPAHCMDPAPLEKKKVEELSREEVELLLLKRKLKKKRLTEREKKKEAQKTRAVKAKKVASKQEQEQQSYAEEFKRYKAQQEERIAQEGAATVLRIKNNSKWNIVVRYNKFKESPRKLPIKSKSSADIELTKNIMDQIELAYVDIVPDGSYWRKNLKKLQAEGKVQIPNLTKKIQRTFEDNPDSSVEIVVTIPQLPGGKFEGFRFAVKPLEAEAFTMTLKEYIKRRKAGEIEAPEPSEEDQAVLEEVGELLQEPTEEEDPLAGLTEEQRAELEELGRETEEGMRRHGLDPNSIEDLKLYMEFKETEARLEAAKN